MPKKKTNSVDEEIKKIVKKKKRKVYFGKEVQDAVVEYNSRVPNHQPYLSRDVKQQRLTPHP